MGINIDFKRDKVESTYKTIYIKNELVVLQKVKIFKLKIY